MLLHVGSVLPVGVCGTFALSTQLFFVLDSTRVLKISLCYMNMLMCYRRRWRSSASVASCVSLAAVLTAGDRVACLKAGPGDTDRPVWAGLCFWAGVLCFQQGYQWLKDKILSEEGRRQQAKLKELQAIAERLGCTLPQLAIGTQMHFAALSLSVCLSVPLPQMVWGQRRSDVWFDSCVVICVIFFIFFFNNSKRNIKRK